VDEANLAVRVAVTELERAQPRAVALNEGQEVRIHVDVLDVAEAVRGSRHREHECGAEEVGHLKTDMVLAMPKRRHLKNTVVTIALDLELLREDRH
jgi:hypothetical protein